MPDTVTITAPQWRILNVLEEMPATGTRKSALDIMIRQDAHNEDLVQLYRLGMISAQRIGGQRPWNLDVQQYLEAGGGPASIRIRITADGVTMVGALGNLLRCYLAHRRGHRDTLVTAMRATGADLDVVLRNIEDDLIDPWDRETGKLITTTRQVREQPRDLVELQLNGKGRRYVPYE